MSKEQDALDETYRTHVRENTQARQDAERRLAKEGSRNPEVRREAANEFKREMTRINDEQQAWLEANGRAEAPKHKRGCKSDVTPEATITDVRHTPGGVVALLSSGEMVRLFRVDAGAVALTLLDDELFGLTVTQARKLAGMPLSDGCGVPGPED